MLFHTIKIQTNLYDYYVCVLYIQRWTDVLSFFVRCRKTYAVKNYLSI